MNVALALLLGGLKKLWDAFAGWIITAGVFAGALLYMLFKGRAQGRAKLKAQLEKADKKAEAKTEKIVKDIQSASESEKDRRMEKWYRD